MKTFLLGIILLCASCCFSQNNPPAKDTLIWSDGSVYSGTLIKQDKGEIQFKTEDGQVHKIAAASVARLKLVNAADDKLPVPEKKTEKKTSRSEQAAIPTDDEPPINWSNPGLSRKTILKHNTGLGLTVTGTTLLVGGVGMLIGGIISNGQTTTTNNYGGTQTNVNVGPVGLVGVLAILAGIPMTIVGAVKLGKAKKMARAEIIYLH